MLRLINFILIAIIIVLLTALYHIRYSADAEIKAINKATSTIRDEQLKQQVLQAEWASLNNPQRLERLASQHLDLVPAHAEQLLELESFMRAPAEQVAPPVVVHTPPHINEANMTQGRVAQ